LVAGATQATCRVYGPPCSEKRRLVPANPSKPSSVRL